MKYIKLTIVLLVVAGAIGFIINLITKGKVSGDIKPEPTDVKTKTIEKRIHDPTGIPIGFVQMVEQKC